MREARERREVSFNLAEVLEHAETAAAADPDAALEIAGDGSCLRFSGGTEAVILAHGQNAPPAGDMYYLRLDVLLAKPVFEGDAIPLEWLRALRARGVIWLRFLPISNAPFWVMTANPPKEQRNRRANRLAGDAHPWRADQHPGEPGPRCAECRRALGYAAPDTDEDDREE
ncbi:hypothetical protein OG339_47935 (plasmid) [Streptosporangium sp. NBC_01495]|uniref:hypothetical protein n=1 Tax=Streptosporangium sp. NBC_01495 TaxID=2903899 RepID=UPI002E331A7A|nr:hypothetical protein [Streptosporangium sp. NBC_01495]